MLVSHTCPVSFFSSDPCAAVAFTPSLATGVGNMCTTAPKAGVFLSKEALLLPWRESSVVGVGNNLLTFLS